MHTNCLVCTAAINHDETPMIRGFFFIIQEKIMGFDYFYPEQAEQFAFFRIPKALFRDRQFKNISTDAKVLYGLMLDRVSLSVKNQWIDKKASCII